MIKTKGRWFKDEFGRTIMLRGVNLGSSSKVPRIPNGATWNRKGFLDHRNVSFVGRPFPLEEADEHFLRLKKWGLTFLRFVITWEAIEYAGPGIYDESYLDYLYKVVKKAGEYGLSIFIDPHQDVWSRFTGGDGAPGWTLEAVGMDMTKCQATGAAITHQEHGDPYPRMIWPTNHGKFACETMWTLFFGGNDFAPQTQVDGVPVQEYLQSHYINSVKQVALRLRELPHVVGYDTMNEPGQGYIGHATVEERAAKMMPYGQSPTILQSMLLAAGYPQKVEIWRMHPLGFRKVGTRAVNPDRVSLWREGYEPIWKQNGVWDVDQSGKPVLLHPDHFFNVQGRMIDFDRDYFRPFIERFIKVIRTVDPDAIIFVEPVLASLRDGVVGDYAVGEFDQIVHAPHWYDAFTLLRQKYFSWAGIDLHEGKVKFSLGRKNVRRSFVQQIKRLVDYSDEKFNGVPTFVGETGVPFNLDRKKAYRTGDFSQQIEAMDDTLHALDSNLVSYTLWNYSADNNNGRGDLWNDEDLSIFSRDQQIGAGGICDGGRALDAIIRPYAARIPGEPIHMSFDIKSKVFEFEFRLDPDVEAPAEFFVPEYQYPDGYAVATTSGRYERDLDEQMLIYHPQIHQSLHRIRITRS
jgi:hypothetical protein